jgi:hypothetical protein
LEVYIEDRREREILGDEITKKMPGRSKQRPCECECGIARYANAKSRYAF